MFSLDDLLDRCLIGNGNMERADVAAAFYERNYRPLVGGAALAAFGIRTALSFWAVLGLSIGP